jgi:hypothetical protein
MTVRQLEFGSIAEKTTVMLQRRRATRAAPCDGVGAVQPNELQKYRPRLSSERAILCKPGDNAFQGRELAERVAGRLHIAVSLFMSTDLAWGERGALGRYGGGGGPA